MNKAEKEVLKSSLEQEAEVLKQLEKQYRQSLNDIIDKVKVLQADIDALQDAIDTGDGDIDKLISMQRSKVYQKQYQENLQAQVNGVLDKLHSDQYTTIQEYLNGCYDEGHTAQNYLTAAEGVPIITPVNQASVVRAVQVDSKISEGLYKHIGVDYDTLKKKIPLEISRGISSGMSYSTIARNLTNVTKAPLANAKRIVRTEGHRIQQAAWKDSAVESKKHGADLVRVWSAVLDARTRDSHRTYDGAVTEVDEPFNLGGHKVDRPSEFGIPAEDINCRCVAKAVPRWALNGTSTKMDNFTGELREFNSPEDYESFKKDYWSKENLDYMKYVEKLENKYGTENFNSLLAQMTDKEYAKYAELEKASPFFKAKSGINVRNVASQATTAQKNIDNFVPVETPTSQSLASKGVAYNKVELNDSPKTFDEIISAVAGGDKTSGSCASAALAYAGQKQGWNVLDFRGGGSMDFFASKMNKVLMFEDLGATTIVADKAKSALTNAKNILKQLEKGKEYYLSAGRHAAIVRRTTKDIIDDVTGEVLKTVDNFQFLELQSGSQNGWMDFEQPNSWFYETIADTFKNRFGCRSSSQYYSTVYATDIGQLTGDDFRTILGYINTAEGEQRKGTGGNIK